MLRDISLPIVSLICQLSVIVDKQGMKCETSLDLSQSYTGTL